MSPRRSIVLVFLAFGACSSGPRGTTEATGGAGGNGDVDAGSGGAHADVAAPSASTAGVWTGTTAQNLPLSFVVADDGSIADLSVRLQIDYGTQTCYMTFKDRAATPVMRGRADLQVHAADVSFPVPVTVTLDSDVMASGTVSGFNGQFDINCAGDRASVNLEAFSDLDFTAHRTGPVTTAAKGDARLTGAGHRDVPLGRFGSGCSQPKPDGRVYCAFARPGAPGSGLAELWVMQPKLLAGKSCDKDDPAHGCQKISGALWMDPGSASLSFADAHGFVGDTLLFRANARSMPGAAYLGPMYAWRPGWTTARSLVGTVTYCLADGTSDAVACVDRARRIASGAVQGDLYAGRLGDGGQALPFIGAIFLHGAADTQAQVQSIYELGFTRGGDSLLWSARSADDAPETLQLLRLGDPPAMARVLGTNVTRWRFSHDGKKLFWIRPTDTAGARTSSNGPLEMIDLPAGGTPMAIASSTSNFHELDDPPPGTRPMLVLDQGGTLSLHPDLDRAPAAQKVLDGGVASLRSFSPGDHFVAYSKKLLARRAAYGDLWILALDGSYRPCQADAGGAWGSPLFSQSGSYAIAEKLGSEAAGSAAFAIDSVSCASDLVAARPAFWRRLQDDRFLMFGDGLPLLDFGLAQAAVLSHGSSWTLDPIADGDVSQAFTLVSRSDSDEATLDLFVSVNAGWKSDGLYQHAVMSGAKAATPARSFDSSGGPPPPTPDAGAAPDAAPPRDTLAPDSGPAPLPPCDFADVATDSHTCAVTAAGAVWCWGLTDGGGVGPVRGVQGQSTPVAIGGLPGPAAGIAVNGQSSCARLRDGSVWCWGKGDSGELGDGKGQDSVTPVKVTGLRAGAIGLGADWLHASAVLADGSAWRWGYREIAPAGQDTHNLVPIPVPGLDSGVVQVAAGWTHDCYRKSDGTVWCWLDGSGLGDGIHDQSVTPVKAKLPRPAITVDAGVHHTCAVLDDNSLWCWGGPDAATPTSTDPFRSNVKDVCVGQNFGCVLRTDGSVWCWGNNGSGELGDQGAPSTGRPVTGFKKHARKLACGPLNVCALDDMGGITCWGDDSNGNAGAGTVAPSIAPTPVLCK